MSKQSTHWIWYLGLGMITASAYAGWAKCAVAQITADGTLPNNSTININGNIFNITGGTQAGSNLFHSFRDFSVLKGNEAHFNNAVDINNIISRVTGSSVSNIDGLIKIVQGNANFFLLNPNGIIFGPNARLDIRGSFVASTANSIKFADGFEFSAKNAQTTPLLTVSVPLGLQFGANPPRIQVQGDSQGIRTTDILEDTQNALRVQPNQTLALVGGDISLEGATLKTAGGRIELGSVGGEGFVSLIPINKGFSLGYAAGQNFGNIELSNQATVDASGAGGGDVQVTSRRVSLKGGSRIEASTLGSQAGGILALNASELVEVSGLSGDGQLNSGLFVTAYPRATGNAGSLTINTPVVLVKNGGYASTSSFGLGAAGDLTIKTGTLQVQDGGAVTTVTGGGGKGGNLTVNATEKVEISGFVTFPNGQTFVSNLTTGTAATENAGDLTINTPVLLIKDGGSVITKTNGRGKGGNLTITADSVQLSNGKLLTEANKGTTGDAGDLTIKARTLQVNDGAVVSSSTFGAGKGGNLMLDASDKVEVIGTYPADNQFETGLFTQQKTADGTGNAGNLTIATPLLLVRDGSFVSASTNGRGNAGKLTINTRRLVVKNAQISSLTYGKGNAGILTVNASDSIDLSGFFSDKVDYPYPAGLLAQVDVTGEGHGGTLNIETGRLNISNGAKVQVATLGQGDAGDLFIRANEIDIFETPQPKYTFYATGIFAGVRVSPKSRQEPKGNGGTATIETNRLRVRDGGVVTTTTHGQGNAGTLRIHATESVEVFGTAPGAEFRNPDEPRNSEISAATTPLSTGNGGSLSIETGKLIVRDRGTVTVRNEGKDTTNQAGDLGINARSIKLDNGSITATTNSGNGGNIFLTFKDLLLLRNQSTISATAGTAQQPGNGGNITIDAPNGFIVAVPFENSDITANAYSGQGGNISIRTANTFNIAPLSREELERLSPNHLKPDELKTNDITAVSQQNPNLSGRVNINTPNVDPSRTLTELPAVIVNTSMIVDSTCAAFAGKPGNQFTITGRGGLPPSPNEPLTTDVVWLDTRLPITTAQQHREEIPTAKLPSQPEAVAIVPATGWVFNGKGQVTLISSASHASSLKSSAASCPQR